MPNITSPAPSPRLYLPFCSGSDISNIETIAIHNEENETFTIAGKKHFVVNGSLADIYVVFARVPTTNTLVNGPRSRCYPLSTSSILSTVCNTHFAPIYRPTKPR